MYQFYIRDKHGFTLVELMISLAIIGILISTTVPLANTYRLKAEYMDLQTTLRYLMDGMEMNYLETEQLYPEIEFLAFGSVTVNAGEEKDIPELKYYFKQGHKHKYVFNRFKLFNIDHSWINVYADFDYNRNGEKDQYVVYMYMDDDKPEVNDYRVIKQIQ